MTAPESASAGVVLAAAGGGRRFGTRKQFLTLAGRPLLHASLGVFALLEEIAEIVVVAPADDLERTGGVIADWQATAVGEGRADRPLQVTVVAGGERRQDSVLAGLMAFGEKIEWALVHDAARPLVRADEVRRVLDSVRAHDAAVLGTPCYDSIKRVEDGRIIEELPREAVWTVQTPQGARLELLKTAYERFPDTAWTDESSALRHMGVTVQLVEGSRENVKITRPGDESLAEFLLRSRDGEML